MDKWTAYEVKSLRVKTTKMKKPITIHISIITLLKLSQEQLKKKRTERNLKSDHVVINMKSNRTFKKTKANIYIYMDIYLYCISLFKE